MGARQVILIAAAGLAGAWSPARAAGIYRYVGEDGVLVISNVAPGKSRGGGRDRGSDEERPVQRPDSAEFDDVIKEACALYRIPVALARAVIAAESNFEPRAISEKGALGLMQLMPRTAQQMYVTDAFDPRQNIFGGVRYLRVLANEFDGDMVRMVAAYNAGPDLVRRAGGVPSIWETQDYVRKVVRLYYAYKTAP